MNTLFFIILIVCGILQIILFFKLWGMTNDVREIKKYLIKDVTQKIEYQNHTDAKYATNDLVVNVNTGRQMRIKEYKNNKYSCYVNNGETFVGDFEESEIRKFN